MSTYAPPEGAPEDFYATLPFADAQAVLRSTVPEPRTARLATCEWHSTMIDPGRGSFAVVRRGGPLEELLGERILVTAGGRSVAAYVTALREIEEDLSLYRRAFLALATLATERLTVKVEVLA